MSGVVLSLVLVACFSVCFGLFMIEWEDDDAEGD